MFESVRNVFRLGKKRALAHANNAASDGGMCGKFSTRYDEFSALRSDVSAGIVDIADHESSLVKKQKSDLEGIAKKIFETVVVQIEHAAEIMGQGKFFGPQQIKGVVGETLESIPNIPFSVSELNRARELDQHLILRVA